MQSLWDHIPQRINRPSLRTRTVLVPLGTLSLASLAQLDRASVFEAECYRFESCRVLLFLVCKLDAIDKPCTACATEGVSAFRHAIPVP